MHGTMKRTIRTLAALAAAALLASSLPATAGEGNPGSSYVVKRGQTLSTIAHDVLGDPELWPAIYWANRDQIKNPKILHVGQRLAIPEITADRAERERIRREAAAFQAPAGPDVASAPPTEPASSTE
jgi:nucleoid-associated protein YgaU